MNICIFCTRKHYLSLMFLLASFFCFGQTSDVVLAKIAECKATKSKRLDIRGLALTEIPIEIKDLTWLDTLDMGDNTVKKIEHLERLVNLKSLSLLYNFVEKIEGLENLKNLEHLDLSFNRIKTIEGLDSLKKLKKLTLGKNEIGMMQNLEQLTDLEVMVLAENFIGEIKNIEKLEHLTYLDLSQNSISKIEVTTINPNLRALFLIGNIFKNVLTQVKPFCFKGYHIHTESFPKNEDEKAIYLGKIIGSDDEAAIVRLGDRSIQQFFQDEATNKSSTPKDIWVKIWICKEDDKSSFSLSGRGLKAIPIEMKELRWLLHLDLSGNAITKIENLDRFIQLKTLDLNNNQIAEITGLSELTALSRLYLAKNKISKIEDLGTLKKLERLDLYDNQINRIEGLNGLERLGHIDFHNNKISKIENLPPSKYLTYLNLNSNTIAKIEGLEQVENISKLDLSSNNISQIEGLDALTWLKVLDLNENKINTITTQFEKLKNLIGLHMSDNQITDLTPFTSILRNQGVTYRNNPITIPDAATVAKGLDAIVLYFIEKGQMSPYDAEVLNKIEQCKQYGCQKLDLNNMYITKIPKELSELTTLKELNLSHNLISNTDELAKMTSLISIDLSHNKITDLTSSVPFLYMMNYRNNPIVVPDVTIVNKGRKAVADYFEAKNSISTLSEAVLQKINECKVTKSETLSLESSSLKSIPKEIAEFTWLKKLNLRNNYIEKIEGLEKLVNLQDLDLSQNRISKIEGLENLLEIKKLQLIENKISKIEGVNQLHKMQEFYLAINKISKIENIEELVALEHLHLVTNKIEDLAPVYSLVQNGFDFSFGWDLALKKGKFIYIADNPLKTPSVKLVYDGRREAVLEYFKTLKK